MIKNFKRFFTTKEKEPVMAQEETQAPVLAVDNTAELATALASLASQAEAIAELTSKYESAQAALAEIEAAKSALIAEQIAAKLAARKEKVETVIGTAKAPALLSATESLDDAAFEAVVSAIQGSVEQESKSELFREVGASGSADALNVEEDAVARLAAKIDAQFKSK